MTLDPFTAAPDVYESVLGIPAGQRPPNHYDLLDLDPEEPSREVIAKQVARRIAEIQGAPWVPTVDMRRIASEMRLAGACLADPISRSRYDDWLGSGTPEPALPDEFVFSMPQRKKRKRGSSIVMGVVVNGMIFVLFIIWLNSRQNVEDEPAKPAPAPTTAPVTPQKFAHNQPKPTLDPRQADRAKREAERILREGDDIAEPGWKPPPGWKALPLPAQPAPEPPEAEALPAPALQPIPDEPGRSEMFAKIQRVYADELRVAGKGSARLSKLAESIFDEAKKSPDPSMQFALFSLARVVAGEAGDLPLALEILDATMAQFDMDPGIEQWAAFQQIFPHHVDAANIALLRTFIDASLAVDDFALASNGLAMLRGKAAGSMRLIDSLKLLGLPKFCAALTKLDDAPNDAGAAGDAGEFYLFVLDRPNDGLRLLAKGDDKTLAELAKMEFAPMVDREQKLKLAEGWRAYADKAADGPRGMRAAKRLAAYKQAARWYNELADDGKTPEGLAAGKFLKGWRDDRLALEQQLGALRQPPKKITGKGSKPAARSASQEALSNEINTEITPDATRALIAERARRRRLMSSQGDNSPIFITVPTPSLPTMYTIPPIYVK